MFLCGQQPAPIVQPVELAAPVEEPSKPIVEPTPVPEPTPTFVAPAESQVEQPRQPEVNVNNAIINGEAPKDVENVVMKLSLNSINPSSNVTRKFM